MPDLPPGVLRSRTGVAAQRVQGDAGPHPLGDLHAVLWEGRAASADISPMDGEEVPSLPHSRRSVKSRQNLVISFLFHCDGCCTSYIDSLRGRETAVSISHPGGRTPLCPSIWGSACVWVCRLHPSQDVQLLMGPFQSQIPGQEGPRAHRPRLGTTAAPGGPPQRAPSFGFLPEKGSHKTQGKRQRP